MRVHFDVSHPAHVHLFRHAIQELLEGGHPVAVTSREKEVTTDLLDAFGIDHTVLSTKGSTTRALAFEWIKREIRTIRFVRRFDPNVVVSRMNPPAVHAAHVTGAKSIVFHDTEIAGPVERLTVPFADVICTPTSFNRDYGDKQHRYRGFQELAYLHPNRFEPDPSSLRRQGVKVDEPYTILRFVSHGAHHDIGHSGIPEGTKRELATALNRHCDVYVSSEDHLHRDLKRYSADIDPEDMHDLLYYANLLVTDSATMATEAAVLGTPVLRTGSIAMQERLGNFESLERLGLVRTIGSETDLVDAAVSTITDGPGKDVWHQRQRRLLEDTIDVTAFMLELIKRDVPRDLPLNRFSRDDY